MDRFRLGNILVSRTNLVHAVDGLDHLYQSGTFGYLCHMDMRSAYLASKDEGYRAIQNRSLMTFADGITLLWYAHKHGYDDVGKVSGKDFMDAVFSISAGKGYSHYFYGSTKEAIEKIQINLKKKYPEIVIHGAVSPPFQPLEDFDVNGLANELNALCPTFFWCGLGAPKQEKLIARLQPRLERTYCAGVGLAFEYLAGTVRRAPLWMQHYGLEWVYRLSQQPRNIGRVILPFLWMARLLLFERSRMGKRKFDLKN